MAAEMNLESRDEAKLESQVKDLVEQVKRSLEMCQGVLASRGPGCRVGSDAVLTPVQGGFLILEWRAHPDSEYHPCERIATGVTLIEGKEIIKCFMQERCAYTNYSDDVVVSHDWKRVGGLSDRSLQGDGFQCAELLTRIEVALERRTREMSQDELKGETLPDGRS